MPGENYFGKRNMNRILFRAIGIGLSVGLYGLLSLNVAMGQPQTGETLPTEGLHCWLTGESLELTGDRVVAWKNHVTGEPASKRGLTRLIGQPKVLFVKSPEGVRQAVRLDGSSGLWEAAGEWGTLGGERTLIFALRVTGKTGGYLFDGSTNVGMSRAYVSDEKWRVGNQPGPIANAKNPSPETHRRSNDEWQVHAFAFKPTDKGAEIVHTGPLGPITATTENKAPQAGLIIGANVETKNGLACDIGEVLVYNRLLSDDQTKTCLSILNRRWQKTQDIENQAAGIVGDMEWEDPRIYRTVIRKEGDDGSKSYRIPGLAVTPKGTLIASFDIRWNGSGDLPSDIDVGVMRSTDQGQSWGPMIVAMDYDKAQPGSRGNGVGDAAILVDKTTGHVFLAALWSYGDRGWNGSGPGMEPEETGQLVIARSVDDGVTWEKPKSITGQVKQKDWRLCFQGPGAGIQLTDETLVFPAQYKNANNKPSSCFIFSRDHGETWQISPPAVPDSPPTSESQIVQLSDGSLLMTMRNESKFKKRVWSRWTWTDRLENGKWVDTRLDVTDPVCMAGLTRHPNGFLLLSNNNSTRRERMTIRYSDNEGKLWSEGKLLDIRQSAYSCLAVLPSGEIGVLYECGERGSVETLTFAKFPLAWVTDPIKKKQSLLGPIAPPAVPVSVLESPVATSIPVVTPPSNEAKDELKKIRALIADKNHPVVWLFTGDSITHGALHTKGSRSYPEHFAERIRWELGRRRDVVINTGISGDMAGGILSDFEHRIGRFKPQVVSIMIGMNDCTKADLSPEQFGKELAELVERIRSIDAIPLLATTNTIKPDGRRKSLPDFNAVIKTVSTDKGVVLVDNWASWQLQSNNLGRWLNDAIHPNAIGHAELARGWFRTLSLYDDKSATCQLGLQSGN